MRKRRNLPEPLSDTMLIFILGSMGWLAVGIVVLMILIIIVRMFGAMIKVQDSYGRFLGIGIGVLFTIQFCFNICMNLGLLPLVGIPLPFISYNGTNIIINMALIGIFLNIYRKKDIILLESYNTVNQKAV